jgi:hypothetical protein
MSEESKKIFTTEEVAQHKEKSSTWIIIHGNVYDVTKFLEEVLSVGNYIYSENNCWTFSSIQVVRRFYLNRQGRMPLNRLKMLVTPLMLESL